MAEIRSYKISASEYEIKHDTLQGREQIIVPVVMMVEGVHCGSAGAVYHSIGELSKFADAWNGIPVSVQHPKDAGQFVSANSPEVIEKQVVGKIFHTHAEGEKLKAECWLDVEILKEVSPETYGYISNKRPLDVSIGVFTEDEQKEGEWRGEHYTSIAHNYRPDHLALLPGGTGACSWEDGAGIRANCAEIYQRIAQKFTVCSEGFFNIAEQLRTLLSGKGRKNTDYYLREVFEDNSFIYEEVSYNTDGSFAGPSQLYRGTYSVDSNGAVSVDTFGIERVIQKISYVKCNVKEELTMENNEKKMTKDEEEMKKKEAAGKKSGGGCKANELITEIITNSACFSEVDREELLTYGESMLEKILASSKKDNALRVNSLKTADDFLGVMPVEMKVQFEEGLKLNQERKDAIVTAIMGYSKAYTKEELTAMSMDQLSKLQSFIPKPNDYSMQGLQNNLGINSGAEEALLPLSFLNTEKK